MERESQGRLPKWARYPLFMIGLLILLIGELSANAVSAGHDAEAVIAALGFVFMVMSVALR